MKKHDKLVEACVLYVDVAIKSYAISFWTSSTFDGFIDCTLELPSVSTCKVIQGQLQIWTEHSTLIFENLKPVEKSKNNIWIKAFLDLCC